jgi:hypothetical protein
LLLFAAAAAADTGPTVEVEVGKTTERDVGYATGWFCDDATIVRGDMITRADHNIWLVTGIKEGSTQCRVGTDPLRVHYVFDVHVIAKHRRNP